MSIARTAAKYGAIITTRTSCKELIMNSKKVTGAIIEDEETGSTIKVRSKTTIMAAGVWTDPLYEQFGLKPGYTVRMSKGAHIVVPGNAIKSETGVIIKTEISVLFIIPWGDKWIVGTTDTDYDESREEPLATRDDVTYILNQANRVLEPKLRREQVIGVFAGLRPLVSTDPDSPTTKLSREHVVDSPAHGFVSIAGGKYTTYRVMSEDAVNEAINHMRKIVPDSVTETLAIIGAEGYSVLINQIPRLAKKYEIHESSVEHLLNRYGSLIDEVLEPARSDAELFKEVVPNLPYLKAEILYAVTHEGARSIDDVISRRTRIAFEAPDQGLSVIDNVADLIAPHLGWNVTQKKASIQEYRAIVERQNTELQTLKKSNSKVS
jgi:glycerol-3-phosphate dehydrogenase